MRRVWVAYLRLVTAEGILLVVGGGALVFALDRLLRLFRLPGLGLLFYLFGLGLSYITVISIIRPLTNLLASRRRLRTAKLPDIMRIIVPELREREELDREAIRDLLAEGRPVSHLDTRRLRRNAVIAVAGLAAAALLW